MENMRRENSGSASRMITSRISVPPSRAAAEQKTAERDWCSPSPSSLSEQEYSSTKHHKSRCLRLCLRQHSRHYAHVSLCERSLSSSSVYIQNRVDLGSGDEKEERLAGWPAVSNRICSAGAREKLPSSRVGTAYTTKLPPRSTWLSFA